MFDFPYLENRTFDLFCCCVFLGEFICCTLRKVQKSEKCEKKKKKDNTSLKFDKCNKFFFSFDNFMKYFK